MAPAPGHNRRRDFDKLSTTAAYEHDPEAEIGSEDDEEDDTSDTNDTGSGRQHYESSENSKLRKPKTISLGPQYRGAKVNRAELSLDDDAEDDPFGKDFDESDQSVPRESDPEVASKSSDDEEEEDDSQDDTADTEVSNAHTIPAIDKDQLRRAMAAERSAVTATLSAANKADAEKGRAVLQQRSAFDALLNTRIKLQKSLIANNSLVAIEAEELGILREEAAAEAGIERAEAAALHLWSSLVQLRQEIDAQRIGHKRKSPPARSDLAAQLEHLQVQEKTSTSHRNVVLSKWSMKAKSVSAVPQTSRLGSEQPATIVDVLNEHLANTDRLMKKARTPRSCAPIQVADRLIEDPKIYDDADLYGVLLKEVLEAKQSASSAVAASVDLASLTSMRRENKTKRAVDTKASKGRKLRYTTHEKLLSYAAPEDRCSWGERQIDELFSSLFGHNMGLTERVADDEDLSDNDNANLIMFKQ